MSYFLEIPANYSFNYRQQSQARCKSPVKYEKSVLAKRHGLRHRRRHNDKKLCLKQNWLLNDSFHDNQKDSKLFLKNRNKYMCKEICMLIKENRTLRMKLKAIDLSSEKDELFRLKKQYLKLEENYQKLQTSHKKAKDVLVFQGEKFKQLCMHHEKSVSIIKKIDQIRNNVIATVDKHKHDNSQLREDIILLKNVIYCLNVEIEKYQDKLRCNNLLEKNTTTGITIKSQNSFEKENILNNWGKVKVHVLGPLLDTYQENINEKDKLIDRYRNELDNFSIRVKEVMHENKNLYTEVESVKKKNDSYIYEIKLLEKDISIIKEQNIMLKKQSIIQKQKLEEIQNRYEKEFQSLSQINSEPNKEYFVWKNELCNLKGKYGNLNASYEELQNMSEKLTSTSANNIIIEEYKNLFEQLNHLYNNDKQKLDSRIKCLEKINQESNKTNISTIAECDELKCQNTKLEMNLKQMKNKIHRLKSTINLTELSRNSFKQRLTKTTLYCENLLKNQEKINTEKNNLLKLLNARCTEKENVQYLSNNIAYRMEQLNNQIKNIYTRDKKQIYSVKKRIKSKKLSISQKNVEYQRELHRFKQLLLQKEEIIQKLQKEKYIVENHLQSIWNANIITDNKKKDLCKKNNKFEKNCVT